MRNEKELRKVLSFAGEILEKEYIANDLVKSIAGSALVCLGYKGFPSKNVEDKAQLVVTASKKDRNRYKEKEIAVAKYILSSRA